MAMTGFKSETFGDNETLAYIDPICSQMIEPFDPSHGNPIMSGNASEGISPANPMDDSPVMSGGGQGFLTANAVNASSRLP
jgi:hypothetical protein